MPNSDLISRAALGISRCNPDVFNDRAYGEGWNACIAIIEAAPAVDAVPVRHGRWVGEIYRENHWHCSECGTVVGIVAKYATYCYKCGALMDGGDPHA